MGGMAVESARKAPQLSALSLDIKSAPSSSSSHSPPLNNLAIQVRHNLQHQHDWTRLTIHAASTLPRPLISGLPPQRIYIHPEEQIALLKKGEKPAESAPEREWVLPTQLEETWSLRRLTEVFDAIDAVPPGPGSDEIETTVGDDKDRPHKRLLLATVSDDSTVVYYILHDGIVKPRQN